MKKINKKKIIVISIICTALICTAAVITAWPSGESYTEETAAVSSLNSYYSFEGNIETEDTQILYASSTSTIKKIYVREGDHVKKGDLLYQLEGENAESKLTQAQASLTSAEISEQDAKSNLDRMSELFQAGAISRSDFEKAQNSLGLSQAQRIQAQANYDTARNELNDLRIYAEIDGEVTDISAEENDTLLSGTEIMDVTNYDQLIVNIKIDEFDLAAINEGGKAEITIPALNKSVEGTISDISKKAQIENGVSCFYAKVLLAQDDSLRVGLSAEVKILNSSASNAVTVSMNALQFSESNESYVFMKDSKGNIVPVPVTVGINDGERVEIKKGLEAGDIVYIKSDTKSSSPSLIPPNPEGRIIKRAGQ